MRFEHRASVAAKVRSKALQIAEREVLRAAVGVDSACECLWTVLAHKKSDFPSHCSHAAAMRAARSHGSHRTATRAPAFALHASRAAAGRSRPHAPRGRSTRLDVRAIGFAFDDTEPEISGELVAAEHCMCMQQSCLGRANCLASRTPQ